ncbi:hypothetical protein BZG36_05274 [Bifiguratus adelaidae]|uniref:Uncharacterized protein n=1 Tax=Bifiguratus adelaidae TaxID=1938954 RepID=A0A261XU29_9FUNG|nr:hypothetical protein BZG36_05274 [Bifiguratus adelaidae]
MQRKSLWGSYKAIPPRTRALLGLGGMAFAVAGILMSDWLEVKYPERNTEMSIEKKI